MPGRVTVRTTDGRELSAEVLHPSGSPGNPLTEDEFRGKFMDMAERVLGSDQAGELYRRARALRSETDVADLAPLLSPGDWAPEALRQGGTVGVIRTGRGAVRWA
jgi:2-methylcitrate dehydratase